jgi:hypothetical protein
VDVNLDNPSNTVELVGLIMRTLGCVEAGAKDLVRTLWAEGYQIDYARCPDCRTIHASYPFARSQHHPMCPQLSHCAHCDAKIDNPDGIVGTLCETCANS